MKIFFVIIGLLLFCHINGQSIKTIHLGQKAHVDSFKMTLGLIEGYAILSKNTDGKINAISWSASKDGITPNYINLKKVHFLVNNLTRKWCIPSVLKINMESHYMLVNEDIDCVNYRIWIEKIDEDRYTFDLCIKDKSQFYQRIDSEDDF